MPIIPSEHALVRMRERGATLEEVEETIELGYQQQRQDGQSTFKKCFDYCREHGGVYCHLKHVTVHAIYEHPNWIVKTVIVEYSK